MWARVNVSGFVLDLLSACVGFGSGGPGAEVKEPARAPRIYTNRFSYKRRVEPNSKRVHGQMGV